MERKTSSYYIYGFWDQNLLHVMFLEWLRPHTFQILSSTWHYSRNTENVLLNQNPAEVCVYTPVTSYESLERTLRNAFKSPGLSATFITVSPRQQQSAFDSNLSILSVFAWWISMTRTIPEWTLQGVTALGSLSCNIPDMLYYCVLLCYEVKSDDKTSSSPASWYLQPGLWSHTRCKYAFYSE